MPLSPLVSRTMYGNWRRPTASEMMPPVKVGHIRTSKRDQNSGLKRRELEADRVRCLGKTSLGTSIGMVASMDLFSAVLNLTEGCELIGPLLLADDILEEQLEYRDLHVWRPKGPGLGVSLDGKKVDHCRRPA